MLRDFTPRPYQAVIFSSAAKQNSLVVLPTGLGKTAIALLLAARRATLYPSSKIVFVAPTKPLVEQQLETFKKHMAYDQEDFALFTGSISPAKRAELWDSVRFIFSTPQTLENDVLANRISLDSVSLLVIDEAHRATGDYAYVFLAKEYSKQAHQSRILALTASPGTDEQKIREIMQNLAIERIEYRKSTDPDVKGFIQETDVDWMQITLTENIKQAATYLQKAYDHRIKKVRDNGYIYQKQQTLSKVQLLKLQQQLHAQAQQDSEPNVLQSISLIAQSLKLQHAIELVQTQSVRSALLYLKSIIKNAQSSKVKAFKQLAADVDLRSAFIKLREEFEAGREHPKVNSLLSRIQSVLEQKSEAKVIVFSQFRDSAVAIARVLEQKGISHSLFFGQAKKNGVGFSQKRQKEVLDSFREGKFSCLIATSVAEEGLDIPAVEHVFFFEPVPSAIRTVQRRGRTGRHQKGFCSVLVAKGTRDEAYRWVAHHKEKRMYDVLERLKGSSVEQKSLEMFSKSSVNSSKIIIDYREKGSPVMKSLRNLSADIELQQLSIGDYVVGPQACIEYKRYDDFLGSIIDGRLIAQLHQLQKYAKPVLLIEKSSDNQLSRRVDQAAIHGMLATISLSYRIPILQSSSPFESAQLLLALAKREQQESSSSFSFHQAKPFSDRELLEYVVSSLPGVGGTLAKSLLTEFNSLQLLFNASVKQLQSIEKIGPKKAQEIYRILHLGYTDAKSNEGLS